MFWLLFCHSFLILLHCGQKTWSVISALENWSSYMLEKNISFNLSVMKIYRVKLHKCAMENSTYQCFWVFDIGFWEVMLNSASMFGNLSLLPYFYSFFPLPISKFCCSWPYVIVKIWICCQHDLFFSYYFWLSLLQTLIFLPLVFFFHFNILWYIFSNLCVFIYLFLHVKAILKWFNQSVLLFPFFKKRCI